jgi:hypothetical protein
MAIEDDDIRDREVWTGVARHWYSKASDKAPTTGRLYLHLIISSIMPSRSVSSLRLLQFENQFLRSSILCSRKMGNAGIDSLSRCMFVKVHGLLFTNKEIHRLEPVVQEFLSLLDDQIRRVTRKSMEQSYQIAVANCVSMLSFASKK